MKSQCLINIFSYDEVTLPVTVSVCLSVEGLPSGSVRLWCYYTIIWLWRLWTRLHIVLQPNHWGQVIVKAIVIWYDIMRGTRLQRLLNLTNSFCYFQRFRSKISYMYDSWCIGRRKLIMQRRHITYSRVSMFVFAVGSFRPPLKYRE